MAARMLNFRQTIDKHNVANKLYKQALLNTICLVAGISIFFFGYDQGLMGGVNTTRNYAELMGFGHWDELRQIVVVDKPVLQGGIVSLSIERPFHGLEMTFHLRSRCITCPGLWSDASWAAG